MGEPAELFVQDANDTTLRLVQVGWVESSPESECSGRAVVVTTSLDGGSARASSTASIISARCESSSVTRRSAGRSNGWAAMNVEDRTVCDHWWVAWYVGLPQRDDERRGLMGYLSDWKHAEDMMVAAHAAHPDCDGTLDCPARFDGFGESDGHLLDCRRRHGGWRLSLALVSIGRRLGCSTAAIGPEGGGGG